jgi:squalene synthase HpnC
LSSAILHQLSLPPDVAAPLERSWTEAESFAYCSALTLGHYENFPVGSALMPKSLQPAVHSLYAFMRTADDFADENRKAGDEAERMAWLESWEAMLLEAQPKHPIFIALKSTLRQYPLPIQWLQDLLHAFKMDVTVRRYETWNQLLEYCHYSANPVGRLILTLFGYRNEELYRLSDSICTGLQLANHWQDVAIDLKKDRIYLPQVDMKRFGVSVETLLKLDDKTNLQRLMAFEVSRARELFQQGKPLPERVAGRLRWELRFTWQGGVRILDKIESANYDVFGHRPVVSKMDWAIIALRCLPFIP